MRRLISRAGLFAILLTLAMVAAGCATLPPLMDGTPAAVAPTLAPRPTDPPASVAAASNAAREALAQQLGIPIESIREVSVGQVDWPDGCLGVDTPGMMCTQAIVPGYQIILEVDGTQYEMRTDLTGGHVVLAPEGRGPASQPEAALRARDRAAIDLGLELGLVSIVAVERVEWPDACLGAPEPAELCAMVVTPGYRVTVAANGRQYVYHTNENGQSIRQAGQPEPPESFPPAAVAARDALAAELGVLADQVNIQSAERVEWPDACLGMAGAGELCAQVITPGYEVVLEYNGEQYVYHTDDSGAVVRSAGQLPATPRGAGEPPSETIIELRSDAGGSCADVRVDLQGVSFGACGSEMTTTEFMAGANRLEQLADMQRTYASFNASTPAGKVTFTGGGPITPSPAEQRMIAEWASLVALETRPGTRIALYGMEWHREGGIAGFCDDIRVDSGGHATWSSCRQGAADVNPPTAETTQAATWRRLTSSELTQFYGWLDLLGAVQVEQKDPAVADQMIVRASLAGRSTGQATEADQDALLQFGATLLQQWADATPVRFINTLAEVNLRNGPGEQFEIIEKLAAGQQTLVTGVSRDAQWWRVVCPDSAVGNCWVSADTTLTEPVTPDVAGQTNVDETQVLAAVIRRIYIVDDTFGGNSRLPVVYLLAVDEVEGSAIPYSSPARPLPEAVRQGIVAALADLPAEFQWVASAGEVKRDRNNNVEGGGAIVTVGNVRPQPDGTIQVTSSIYLGPIAAGGQTYVLENRDGKWQVTGTTGAQWIS